MKKIIQQTALLDVLVNEAGTQWHLNGERLREPAQSLRLHSHQQTGFVLTHLSTEQGWRLFGTQPGDGRTIRERYILVRDWEVEATEDTEQNLQPPMALRGTQNAKVMRASNNTNPNLA